MVAVVLAGSCTSGDDAGDAHSTSDGSAAPVAAEWPTAGADLDNSRTAPSSEITSANVDELEVGWERELPEAGTLSTAPVVVDGVVYLQDSSGSVNAIDQATGDVRWTSEPTGANIGPFGVAVDEERVYALDAATGVLALSKDDGEPLWSTDITATDSTGVGIQPLVVDDIVLASSVPVSIGGIYAPGDRGVISALDAETGELLWEFDTVLGDDLWGHPEVNSGGGAWYPPAVDLETRTVYVGTGNPAPFPGTPEWPNGTSRPGDNLYTDSILALDLDTGALRWFHQVTPHDLFDRDQIHALVARPPGADPVVVSAGKSGVVVGLDPVTGDVAWRTEVGLHQNDDLLTLDGPTEIAPGTFGGVLTPPATADGIVYLASVRSPTTLLPDETAYFGAPMGVGDGEVTAVDATDGEVLWTSTVDGDPLGGAAVVGDLVLTALLDGTVLALDRATGEEVWRHATEGSVNGWLAVAGDDLVVPVAASPPKVTLLRRPG